VVAKAEDITLVQIDAALPPPGVAASVDALDLVDDNVAYYLSDPWRNVIPRSDWPPVLPKARMRVADGEWPSIAKRLVELGVCARLKRSELITHHGQALLNGIFGVSKGKQVYCPKRCMMVNVLRLIINLIPSNSLQRIISGDVGALPHFGQWLGLELLDGEVLVWNGEDMSCAFYIFRTPRAWAAWFALAEPVHPWFFGEDGDEEEFLGLVVLPMGWCSASGCANNCLRALTVYRAPRGAGIGAQFEIRKDRPLPVDLLNRVTHFLQSYIDNFDQGHIGARGDASTVEQMQDWRSRVLAAYERWGIPAAKDKSTQGTKAATLGASIDGEVGVVGPGRERSLDLIELTLYLLRQRVPSVKSLAMAGGRWIFAMQFRRPTMCVFMRLWDVLNLKVGAQARLPAVAEEFVLCLCCLPLMLMDLRCRVTGLTTCSDASEEGGGVCTATGLTAQGLQRLSSACRQTGGNTDSRLAVLETFGGISGLRRAVEILGVTPAAHLSWETCEAACRVAKQNYPDVQHMGDVKDITTEQIVEALRPCTGIDFVLHASGPPCQDVSGLSAGRKGVSGERSGLMALLPLVRQQIRAATPRAEHGDLMEMVASLSQSDQLAYDEINQSVPVRLCPSSHWPVRRPRLYWITWALSPAEDVSVEETERWTAVQLCHPVLSRASWLPRGWWCHDASPLFPTLTRGEDKKKPPFKPAGLSTLDQHEYDRWVRDKFAFPAYQYKDKYMVKKKQGPWQPPPAIMRELLMGFPKDFTYSASRAAERKGNPRLHELTRCSLIGNGFHTPTVAWLISHQLSEWGIIRRPATVAEVTDLSKATALGVHYSDEAVASVKWGAELSQAEAMLRLVRWYLSKTTHRGGDIKVLSDSVISRLSTPAGIDAGEWQWRDVISTRWTLAGEHINVYETRALLLALRWRMRDAQQIRTRFLHLVDSQVALGICANGRTSSWRLRRALSKVNAILLASHSSMALGYVRSHQNPADRPSRRCGRTSAVKQTALKRKA